MASFPTGSGLSKMASGVILASFVNRTYVVLGAGGHNPKREF
jgi:hypothetical protein